MVKELMAVAVATIASLVVLTPAADAEHITGKSLGCYEWWGAVQAYDDSWAYGLPDELKREGFRHRAHALLSTAQCRVMQAGTQVKVVPDPRVSREFVLVQDGLGLVWVHRAFVK